MGALSPSQATNESEQQLVQLVEQILEEAKSQGASAAEANIGTGQGLAVTVRLGEVETVEHNRDKGLSVTVYFGKRSGSASTSDFSPAAVRDSVRAACTIAKYTAEDACAGLADTERLAKNIPDLALYHPWKVDVERAIALAHESEDVARQADARITNSEGATVYTHQGLDAYGNSHGFIGSVASTRHNLSCAVIGQDSRGMQRDYWHTVARDPSELETPAQVGGMAATRTLRRLGARQLATCATPVIFEAPIASSLLAHFVTAIRGSRLYRHASFLLDHAGKQVFSPFVHIFEQPHLKKALGSAPFDDEGVATAARDLVKGGVLLGYVLDSYSARKLGLQTTGNAGGVHNLTIQPGSHNLPGLLKQMDTGLLVTELIGFGVNTVTGDYSRGAVGFWVEGGEIQYPVEEITIAGNLKDMFMQISEVGNDIDARGSIRAGSILIANMMVAGK